MMTRRKFLAGMAAVPVGAEIAHAAATTTPTAGHAGRVAKYSAADFSDFSKRLRPVGRILEMEGCYVWCNAPIEDEREGTHVFFSRWPAAKGMGGWINSCEIAHAVADSPEGPFSFVGTVLAPRGPGHWDATTCHNPHIQKVGDRYALFFMGNANGRTGTKRISLALADSPDGPWQRPDAPLLEPVPRARGTIIARRTRRWCKIPAAASCSTTNPGTPRSTAPAGRPCATWACSVTTSD